MPYYDHDKDYPFAAFITNLGKYNEGELVGEWVKFPTTAEELKEVFKRIGIGQKDDFGQPYEEWFITDYDCYVDGLYSKLGEYENQSHVRHAGTPQTGQGHLRRRAAVSGLLGADGFPKRQAADPIPDGVQNAEPVPQKFPASADPWAAFGKAVGYR